MGTPVSTSGSHPSLARVLFGPGRGVFARPGSGSSVGSRALAQGGTDKTTASNAAFPAPVKSVPRYPDGAPAGGPVSTARASTSPTAPVAPRGVPGSGSSKARLKPQTKPSVPLAAGPTAAVKTRAGSSPPRTWVLAGVGVAVAVLFVAGAVVAFQLGKGTRADVPADHPPTNPDAPKTPGTPGVPKPGPADVIIAPARAGDHENEEQTVELKVARTAGTGGLVLAPAADAFEVRVAASCFGTPGERDKLRREMDEKVIRVRGTIKRDQQGLHIDVAHLDQIVPVRR
jgi:hypothetical protein